MFIYQCFAAAVNITNSFTARPKRLFTSVKRHLRQTHWTRLTDVMCYCIKWNLTQNKSGGVQEPWADPKKLSHLRETLDCFDVWTEWLQRLGSPYKTTHYLPGLSRASWERTLALTHAVSLRKIKGSSGHWCRSVGIITRWNRTGISALKSNPTSYWVTDRGRETLTLIMSWNIFSFN